MLSWLSYNDYQLFAQFYHLKVVFQKASSKEPRVLLCCAVVSVWGKAELSHVKGIALSQEPNSLEQDLLCCESPTGVRGARIPTNPVPTGPSLGGNMFPTTGCAAVLLQAFSFQNWNISSAPISARSTPSFPESHLQHGRCHKYNYPGSRAMDFTLHYVDPA